MGYNRQYYLKNRARILERYHETKSKKLIVSKANANTVLNIKREPIIIYFN